MKGVYQNIMKLNLTDAELAELVELEMEYLLTRYDYKIEDLDFLGEPTNEYITEKDLMIEI